MSKNFEQIYLNKKAYSYVQEQLGLSGSLSVMLGTLIANSVVKIWGFFSKGISEADLTEFEYGGKFAKNPRQEVAYVIKQCLENDMTNAWILIDNTKLTKYPREQNTIEDVTTVFYYSERVLHLLTKKPFSLESIIKTFTFGGAYPYIGFITKIRPAIEEEIKKNNVKKESIEFLVKNISLIVIGAYDEEGYLIVEIEE